MCSALATCREPWNMTCSKRWAKPVLPGTSCLEPTAYQRLTATTGARWSSATITRRPLARRWSLKTTSGTDVGTQDLGLGSFCGMRRGRSSWEDRSACSPGPGLRRPRRAMASVGPTRAGTIGCVSVDFLTMIPPRPRHFRRSGGRDDACAESSHGGRRALGARDLHPGRWSNGSLAVRWPDHADSRRHWPTAARPTCWGRTAPGSWRPRSMDRARP